MQDQVQHFGVHLALKTQSLKIAKVLQVFVLPFPTAHVSSKPGSLKTEVVQSYGLCAASRECSAVDNRESPRIT